MKAGSHGLAFLRRFKIVTDKKPEDSPGIKDTIKLRLLEATDDDSLRSIRTGLKEEGFNPGSIDACVSDLRKQGHLKFNAAALAKTDKALPIEGLIKELALPDIVDGQKAIFDAGVSYGMRSILIGVRIAQELSSMGIAQAWPMLAMAKELRMGDNQALQAANAASERVLANVMPQLASLRASVNTPKPPTAPPPKTVDEAFVRPINKIMERMVDMTMDRMMPGLSSGKNPDWEYVEETAPASKSAPGQSKASVTSGWTEETETETDDENK